jgi:CheY-like chemotaxis protein/HPt (histidine-containing phosphotransfer) domain-containing protein
VLLDVMMPEMDGFTVAEQIRRDPRLADCRLVILSSAGDTPSPARCEELGISRSLTKPVRQSDLLDAVLRALSAGRAEAAAEADDDVEQAASRPLRLLLAEDSLVNQRVAVGLLEMRGHHVTVANNGKEALAALARDTFDVVLMDVQMPEMDGMEATAAIRAGEAGTGRHMPIIAMTAHAMKGDRERCLAAGMDGYISKPIQTDTLYQAVESMAAAHAGPGPAEAPLLDPVLDWAAALKRMRGRADHLQQIARLFVEEAEVALPAIREAIAAADGPRLRRAAHTLKGSAGCLAAKATVEAAECLECMGRDADFRAADAARVALEHEVGRLLAALAERASA